MRIAPVVIQYYQKTGMAPKKIATGFATYLLFIKGISKNLPKM